MGRPAPRVLAALVAVPILLPAVGTARAGPAERGAFLARHRCAVVARLDAIHRRGPTTTSRDRFITITVRGRPQHDVQCIFHDRDATMLCEASSGAYGPAPAAEPFLSHDSVAALHALGFAQATRRENFSREITLGSPPAVRIAADLMLAALHDAYGARVGRDIEIAAPRGDGSSACDPPAS